MGPSAGFMFADSVHVSVCKLIIGYTQLQANYRVHAELCKLRTVVNI